jgi:hypothetical protein
VYISQNAALAATGCGGPEGTSFFAVSAAVLVSVVIAGPEEQPERPIAAKTKITYKLCFMASLLKIVLDRIFYARQPSGATPPAQVCGPPEEKVAILPRHHGRLGSAG